MSSLPTWTYARAMLAVSVRNGTPPDQVAEWRRTFRAAKAAKSLRDLLASDLPPTVEQRRELAEILLGGGDADAAA